MISGKSALRKKRFKRGLFLSGYLTTYFVNPHSPV